MKNTEANALKSVQYATGETFLNAREALLWLAEDGAFDEYDGDGWFSDDFRDVHIDEMSDTFIIKLLIRSYGHIQAVERTRPA